MQRSSVWVVIVLAGLFRGFAQADEILFKNGDRLSGKIETSDGAKIWINTAVAGKVAVELKMVKTFSTDAPIEIDLADGTVIHQRIIGGGEGTFGTAPGGLLQPQQFKVADMKKVNPPAEKWTGNLVAGGMIARGNTNTDSIHTTVHAVRKSGPNRLTLDGGYIYERDRPQGGGQKRRTADDWFVEGKFDRFFTEKFYGYVDARVERDLIANLSLRLTPGVGVGYQWFNNPNDFTFNTEAGVSWLYRSFRNDGSTDSVAIRGAYHLTKKLNDKLSLFHNFEIFPGLDSIDNFYLDTDAGFHVSVTDKLFTEFKIQYKHDQHPAPGAVEDDLRYIVGIGWTF